jgi:AraC-like DNA-binding protein/quercetin dioxygenase-like cupin family protein
MTIFRNQEYLESATFPFAVEPFILRPGEEVPWHQHEFVECVYVDSGAGSHLAAGGTHAIGAGHVFIIAPQVEHAYVGGSPPLSGINLLFDTRFFTTELLALSEMTSFLDLFYLEPFIRAEVPNQGLLQLNVKEQLEVKTLLDTMVREFQQRPLGYPLMIRTALLGFFVLLSRIHAHSRRSSSLSALDDATMMTVLQTFIRQHAPEPLTLSQMCQLSGMSVSSFSEKFRRYSGCTFVEFRNRARIRLAASLLVETGATVEAIAQEVGFSDVSFFHHQFRRWFRLSPGEYRHRNRTRSETAAL